MTERQYSSSFYEATSLVPLPREWQRWNTQMTEITSVDKSFIQDLLDKYGLYDGTKKLEGKKKPFKRTEFFLAVADAKRHFLQVRNALDGNFPTYDWDLSDEKQRAHFEQIEKTRPSSKRLENVANLFFGIPAIRTESRKLHEEKLARAFPAFARELPQQPFTLLQPETFGLVAGDFLAQKIIEISPVFGEKNVINTGFLNNYRNSGFIYPSDEMLTWYFASLGTGTFITHFNKIVVEALQRGIDVSKHIRHEFLDNDGTAQQIMHIAFGDFDKINGTTLDEAREILAEEHFQKGKCPAMGTIEGYQIAYLYAQTMVSDMITRKILPPRSN